MAKLTLEQFGETIKQKNPEYKDMDSKEVGQKMLSKYPQYKDMVQEEKKPLSAVSKFAGGTLAGLGGAALAGEAMERAGKSIYGITYPPNMKTAGDITKYKAGTSNIKPRTLVDTAIETPLVQKGSTRSPSSFVGQMGTRSQIGVQSEAKSKNIFKDVINPLFQKADEAGEKVKFNQLKQDAIQRVKNSKMYSNQKKKEVIEDVVALFEDLKGNTSYKNLDSLKSEIYQKLPKKYFSGKPMTQTLKDAQGIVSNVFRNKVHNFLTTNYGVDTARKYIDYANLQALVEQGKKSMSQGFTYGGFAGGASGLFREAATPITTTVGKLLYKGGNIVKAIPKTLWSKGISALKGGVKSGTLPSIIAGVATAGSTPDTTAFEAMQMIEDYKKNPDSYLKLEGGSYEAVKKEDIEEWEDGTIKVGAEVYDKNGKFIGPVM